MAAHPPHYPLKGISKLSSTLSNSLHGLFDLSPIPSTNTCIVDATTRTYDSNRTPSSDGVIVPVGKENNTYVNSFNSRITDTGMHHTDKRQ